MNDMLRKILLFDKTILALTVLSLIAVVTIIVTSIYANETKSRNKALRSQLSEINSLASGVLDINSYVQSKEKKIGLRKTKGVVSTMQQTLKSLNLTAKTIKPLDKKKVLEYFEENAELELENADLNQIVNLLYKIETSSIPIKIKSSSIRTSFEDPDKFTLKIMLALITKG